jgi:hypothetical protein
VHGQRHFSSGSFPQSRTTWTLATFNQAVHELMKTYVDHPPRQLQSEGYSGPITLSQFERFQWARDKLKEGGLSLLMRAGIEPRPVLSGRVTAAAPLELEPLVKGARIPELCDIFLHKAETSRKIISDDKPVDRTHSASWPGRKRNDLEMLNAT